MEKTTNDNMDESFTSNHSATSNQSQDNTDDPSKKPVDRKALLSAKTKRKSVGGKKKKGRGSASLNTTQDRIENGEKYDIVV